MKITNPIVANALATRRVATNAIGDSEIKQFEKECTSCISKLKELDKAIIRVQYLYSSIIRDMTIDGNVVNRVRSLHGDLHDVAWGCANKIS